MTGTHQPIDIGLMISKPPVESGIVASALGIAHGAMVKGQKVGIFLISDGVWIAKKNQKNHAAELFGHLVKGGATVTASDEHLAAAGITENEIVEGIHITKKTYKELVRQVMEDWSRVVSI